jgi:hypothetical protein
MKQITNAILMVRPVRFRMNEQTAVNNFFQEDLDLKNQTINAMAQQEFDSFVQALRNKGVQVVVVNDTFEQDTPDSIFPNNWNSFHEDGTVALYPMFAENRRRERREDILETLEQEGFEITSVMDYTAAEADGLFLEGTGSIVMDRENRIAYCSLSDRADEGLFIEFCEDFEYTPVIFTSYQSVDGERKPIYHTNVMMCLGEQLAVICLDAIDDKKERKNVSEHLLRSGKEIVLITEEQLHHFAGNMLQVEGRGGQRLMVMSSSAFKSLTSGQVKTIEKFGQIVHSSLETIEICGGGSARCMMAEIFLPRKA